MASRALWGVHPSAERLPQEVLRGNAFDWIRKVTSRVTPHSRHTDSGLLCRRDQITERSTTMKWNYKLSLTTITGLAILLPMSAFAEDQNQDGKKEGKKNSAGQKHAGKGTTQAGTLVVTPAGGTPQARHVHNEGKVNNASSGQGHVSHVVSGPETVQRSNVPAMTTQRLQPGSRVAHSQRNQSISAVTRQSVEPVNQVERGQRSQTQVYSRNQTRVYSNQQQYNRANNYGGLWFAADTHRDWNRNGQHSWNNHQYRWYEGGWLIIDGGYSPYYSNTGYSYRASTARGVQMRLAEQGYYRGPIDGDIGPGSRNAIASYQSDHDLRVTGRINDPLLESLRL